MSISPADDTFGGTHLSQSMIDRLSADYRELVRARIEERDLVVPRASERGTQRLARRIGAQDGGPRDVVAIHLTALRPWVDDATPARGRAVTSAGESVLIEVMGHLANTYRHIALGEGEADLQETGT